MILSLFLPLSTLVLVGDKLCTTANELPIQIAKSMDYCTLFSYLIVLPHSLHSFHNFGKLLGQLKIGDYDSLREGKGRSLLYAIFFFKIASEVVTKRSRKCN